MKLLHTSDWHVGKQIRGVSRIDEHRSVLAEIVGIAEQEQIDLVVVAGDLFDSAVPPAEAEELVYRTLLGLARTDARVVVIAGNHDNARRLAAIAPLFALGRVVVVAEPTRPDAGGLVAFEARDGSRVQVATLPFVSKRGIVRAEHLMQAEAFEQAQLYSDRLRLLIDTMCAPFNADTVNVLAAHGFVFGAAAGGGERAAHLVEEYAITAQSFPPTIGYAALGHLHRPQRIAGAAPLQYCGSPIQLDFGETDQTKQVNVAELRPGVPADIKAVPLRSGRPLRTIRGTVEQLEAMQFDDDPWLRVVIEGETSAGVAERVREVLGAGVVDVRIHTERVDQRRTAISGTHRSPQDLFDEYLAHQQVGDQRIRALFHELVDADHEEYQR